MGHEKTNCHFLRWENLKRYFHEIKVAWFLCHIIQNLHKQETGREFLLVSTVFRRGSRYNHLFNTPLKNKLCTLCYYVTLHAQCPKNVNRV